MIIEKSLVVKGTQAYTLTQSDVIVVKVKSVEEFRYKVPDNFQGTVTITINGILTEITPT
jgi:hypothetical protein